MTSRKLSARKLFGRLLKQEMFHKIWAEAIAAVLLCMVLPIHMALDLGQYAEKLSEMPDSQLLNSMVSNEALLVLLFGLGIFFAVVEFGYLFQKNKVDFYYSLPISRTMHFLYRYLNGVLLFVIPYVIWYGVSLLIGIAHGAMIIGYVEDLAVLGLVYLLFFLVSYSVSVIGMQIAGSYISSIVTLGMIHFAGIFFCLVVHECQDTFFRTYVDTGKTFLYGSGSAVTICIKMLDTYQQKGVFDLFDSVILAAMVFLLPFLAYALFLKRPVEKTGCGLAYPAAGPLIRILAVLFVGMMTGLVLRELAYSNQDIWMYFGVVVGCILMHCIVQMVLQMNFRAFFCGKLSLIFCVGAALFLMSVFRFDLIGYDRYIPQEDELEAVGISMEELESYRAYYKDYTEEEYQKIISAESSWNHLYNEDLYHTLEEMNLKNSRPVLDMARESVADDQWEQYESNMMVCYRLKNGRKIFRRYRIDLHKELVECSEIFAMDRYKEVVYPILTRGEASCGVWLYDNIFETRTKLSLTDTRFINLLRTYKRELKELDLMTLTKEEPIALIEFTDNLEGFFNSYPIYPSFKHTLTLLKGYGYEVKPHTDSIYKMQIIYEEEVDSDDWRDNNTIDGMDVEEWRNQTSDNPNAVWIEDQKMLDALKRVLIFESDYYTNLTLKQTEPGYYVTGYLIDESTKEEMAAAFRIEKGKLPKFLEKLKENAGG